MSPRPNTKADAVMARRRKRDDNEGLTEEEQRWKLLDLYGTPPFASRAGAEVALELWPEAKIVREPACGYLSMSDPLSEYFETVIASDVYAHVLGVEVRDFFDAGLWPEEPDCDVILTNPPFFTAAAFLRAALPRARLGVGMLVRTVWVESNDRYDLFENDTNPLTLFCPFSERVPMALGPWDPEVGSATSYSWMFWGHGMAPRAPRWIPPGTRDRLWRKDDAARFGRREPMPLFPEDPGDVL